jgi:hypothetical protein
MYFTQNTNDSTVPPNQKLILKSHKIVIRGYIQKPALISLILKPKYPHLPQVQLQPLYMGRGTNWVQRAGKCSWKSLLLATLACPDAHHLQPKTYQHTYKDNMILSCHPYLQLSLLPLIMSRFYVHKFNMFHICALNDNSIYTTKPANSSMWIVFSTCSSLLTCFNHSHSHIG